MNKKRTAISMVSQIRHVWKDTRIDKSPAQRRINLAYENVEKVLLYVMINVGSSGSYLDPSRPIKVNNKQVNIPDLPQNASFLGLVEKSDIDITDLLKISPNGENNLIEVNFIRKKSFWSRKPAGTLNLSLTITIPDNVIEVVKQQAGPKTKFCMHCGRAIPNDAGFCPYCSLPPPPGGAVPKDCRNCGTLLPPTARYCQGCGNIQPEAQS